MPDHAATALPVLDASDAPESHPLVSQLSALHQFRIQVDVAVVVMVLVLTNLIAHFTTPWASVATVPAAAVGLVILMRANGLDWTDLGLGREHWKCGLGYALAAVAVVGSVIAVGVLLPMTRPMFMNNHYATISGALIASMVVIPLQTVIPEELAFRGVLNGALHRAWGFRGGGAGRVAAFRSVARRHFAGPHQQQRRLHPAVRRRVRRDAGRGDAGGAGHRIGRGRLPPAAPGERRAGRPRR